MASDRRPLLTTLADKTAARDYVQARVGASYLTDVYGVFKAGEHLRLTQGPSNYVVKPNHASGAVVIVWDDAPSIPLPTDLRKIKWDPFLVHPTALDWSSLEALAVKWLSQNYYWDAGQFPEWAYKDIPPRIIFEELMLDSDGLLPSDYKFYMFDGECRMIQVNRARFSAHHEDFYSPTWDKLHVQWGVPNSTEVHEKPKRLEEMLDVARTLSEGIDFVRVDLYETSRGVRFGEFCNYPGGGTELLEPRSFDQYLGESWVLTQGSSQCTEQFRAIAQNYAFVKWGRGS
jgi:hypothetical protein